MFGTIAAVHVSLQSENLKHWNCWHDILH